MDFSEYTAAVFNAANARWILVFDMRAQIERSQRFCLLELFLACFELHLEYTGNVCTTASHLYRSDASKPLVKPACRLAAYGVEQKLFQDTGGLVTTPRFAYQHYR